MAGQYQFGFGFDNRSGSGSGSVNETMDLQETQVYKAKQEAYSRCT